ncbi:MAG: hypothetical protein WCF85_05430 [Rhodospirillaceae bacterium]
MDWFFNNIEVMIGLALGVLMSIVYVLSGWNSDLKDAPMESNPRIKNMIWVLGVFISILMLDLSKAFNSIATVDKTKLDFNAKSLEFTYVFTFAFFTIIVLLSMAIIQGYRYRSKSSYNNTLGCYSFWDAFSDYLHYGSRFVEKKFDELLSETKDKATKESANRRANLTGFTTLVNITLKALDKRDLLADAINALCNDAMNVYISALRDKDTNVSFKLMKSVNYEDAGLFDPNRILCKAELDKSNVNIGKLLVAIAQTGDSNSRYFLPVPDFEENFNYSIPGAGQSFATEKPVIISTGQPDIDPTLPDQWRNAIIDYYKHRNYSTVLCIPVKDTSFHCCGVLVILCDWHKVSLPSAPSETLINEVVEAIIPVAQLLGALLPKLS